VSSVAAGCWLLSACGSDKPVNPDSTPPEAVVDLVVAASGENGALLRWTAPGDDANEGRATSYEVRYSTTLMSVETFPTTTLVPAAPTPGAAGDKSVTVAADSPCLEGTATHPAACGRIGTIMAVCDAHATQPAAAVANSARRG
jgi:hypothetical protein